MSGSIIIYFIGEIFMMLVKFLKKEGVLDGSDKPPPVVCIVFGGL